VVRLVSAAAGTASTAVRISAAIGRQMLVFIMVFFLSVCVLCHAK
jgi:hypothetical protein